MHILPLGVARPPETHVNARAVSIMPRGSVVSPAAPHGVCADAPFAHPALALSESAEREVHGCAQTRPGAEGQAESDGGGSRAEDTLAQLERAEALHAAGAISDAEYTSLKARLLDTPQ